VFFGLLQMFFCVESLVLLRVFAVENLLRRGARRAARAARAAGPRARRRVCRVPVCPCARAPPCGLPLPPGRAGAAARVLRFGFLGARAAGFAVRVSGFEIWGAGAAGFAVAFSRPRLGLCASIFSPAWFARGVRVLGFGLWGLGFEVWAGPPGFAAWALGFGLWGSRFGVWVLGFGFWARGLRFRFSFFFLFPPAALPPLLS
jgi:hypothetical protein